MCSQGWQNSLLAQGAFPYMSAASSCATEQKYGEILVMPHARNDHQIFFSSNLYICSEQIVRNCFLFPRMVRQSWHMAYKFSTLNRAYLTRSTEAQPETLVIVKRELHCPNSCQISPLSQWRESTSASRGWFTSSSGHLHLGDESPIPISLPPSPPICWPWNQHSPFTLNTGLLGGYSWKRWIHPENLFRISESNLSCLFSDWEQSSPPNFLDMVHYTLINYFIHWCHALW